MRVIKRNGSKCDVEFDEIQEKLKHYQKNNQN